MKGIDIEAIHNNPDNDQSFNKNAFSELSRRIFTLRKRVKEMGLDVNHWFYSNRLFGCQAEMPNSYTILPDGNFIICTGLDTIDKFTIGYLNTNGKLEKVNLIKERWNADNPLSIEECKNCKLFPICLGGCTFARIEKQRPSCLIEKYQINDYLRLLI